LLIDMNRTVLLIGYESLLLKFAEIRTKKKILCEKKKKLGKKKRMANVLNIPPQFYIHVIDNNTNITRLETGPQRFTPKQHERVLCAPREFVVVPPQHYCVISNPIVCASELPYKLKWKDAEIRFAQQPFPLYPGEVASTVQRLQHVAHGTALRLEALRDFTEKNSAGDDDDDDDDGATTTTIERKAGDQWLFVGPATFEPRVDVQIVQTVNGRVIGPNQALRVRATRDIVGSDGSVAHLAGEEWLVRSEGLYIPGVDEAVVGSHSGVVLTADVALHMRARRSFKDQFGAERKAGDEWLVTRAHTECYIAGVEEELVRRVALTKLTRRQYCVVLNPYDVEARKHLVGKKELRRGPGAFFLQPAEELERGQIQDIEVLAADEALLLQAIEAFDDDGDARRPGDRWMVHGSRTYVPPVEVEIVERRRAIPLSSSEGVYVRDRRTGAVRAVIGKTYMLRAEEELWAKELPPLVEELLRTGGGLGDRADIRKVQYFSDYADQSASGQGARDKSRVVAFRAPGNTAVQIYDSKSKTSRIEFGPALILLEPYEEFTVLHLSAGKPKREGALKSLCLLLGPDYITEDYEVETADHARLRVRLAANVHFDFDRADERSVAALFNIPDFIGAACRSIGSRVRGRVASSTFDEFHKNSAAIISSAVFGSRRSLRFDANNLVLTNIDVQSVETIDEKTRASLQKSVQLAIEITTKSQEAEARQDADRREQTAKGQLQLQVIENQATQEQSRESLVQLCADNSSVQIEGDATAEAKAHSTALDIAGASEKQAAELRVEALGFTASASQSEAELRAEAELKHKKALYELEVKKQARLAQIEADKFKRIINAIGRDTVIAMASAGPELQARLLGGLGLKSVLISDGKAPVNLMNLSTSLVSGQK
jgi:major vault protein